MKQFSVQLVSLRIATWSVSHQGSSYDTWWFRCKIGQASLYYLWLDVRQDLAVETTADNIQIERIMHKATKQLEINLPFHTFPICNANLFITFMCGAARGSCSCYDSYQLLVTAAWTRTKKLADDQFCKPMELAWLARTYWIHQIHPRWKLITRWEQAELGKLWWVAHCWLLLIVVLCCALNGW